MKRVSVDYIAAPGNATIKSSEKDHELSDTFVCKLLSATTTSRVVVATIDMFHHEQQRYQRLNSFFLKTSK
jgi:hypothetical protein